MKKITFSLVLVASVIGLLGILFTTKVSANTACAGGGFSPPTVFDHTCMNVNYFDGGTNYGVGGDDVFNKDGSWGTGLKPIVSDYNTPTKDDFIKYIEARYNKGNSQSRTGAAFIIGGMTVGDRPGLGRNISQSDMDKFEAVVNNPAVTLKVEDADYTVNSEYSHGDDIFYQEDSSRQDDLRSLSFYVKGSNGKKTLFLQLKVECANFTGSPRPLPPPPPKITDQAPTGYINLHCNANGTGYVTFKFGDSDGGTYAYVSINYTSGTDYPSTRFNNDNTVYTLPYSKNLSHAQVGGNWSAKIVVNDVNSAGNDVAGGDRTFTDSSTGCKAPDNNPTGYINLHCNANGTGYVTYKFGDVDNTTNATLSIKYANGTDYGPIKATTNNVVVTLPSAKNISHAQVGGNWSGKLVVHDIDVDGATHTNKDQTYTDTANCPAPVSHAPAGSLGFVCTPSQAVTGTNIKDADSPTTQLKVYVYNNQKGAGGTLISPIGGITTSTNTHSFAFGTSSLTSTALHHFYIYADGVNTAGTVDSSQSQYLIGEQDGGPCGGQCANPAQGLATSLPINAPVQHIVLKAVATTSHPAGAVNPGFTNIAITGPVPVVVPSTVPATSNGGTDISGGMTLPVLTTPGAYTLRWSWSSAAICTQSFSVGYTPYFNVKGGDTVAGAQLGCDGNVAANTSADLKTWNTDDPASNYAGGGADLAAFAGGDIAHFPTGQAYSKVGTPPFNAVIPNALAFANTPAANFSAPTYGGSFGSLPCEPDYYSDSDQSGASTLPQNLDDFSTFPSDGYMHTYNLTGDLIINSANKIVAGQQLTLRVNGNVYINKDILYGPYTLGNVPRLNLYVTGNIFISPSVKEMHGLYVAEKQTGSTAEPISGVFATCYGTTAYLGIKTDTTHDPETTNYATCNPPTTNSTLTIYGAVTADTLHFDRTYGNLYQVGSTPAAPAEVIQYTPELWLGGDVDCSTLPAATGCGEYQTINGLPPVL